MIQYRTYPGAKTLDQFFMPFLKARVAWLWLEDDPIDPPKLIVRPLKNEETKLRESENVLNSDVCST